MRFDPAIEVLCEEGVYEPAEDSRLMIGAISVSKGDKVLEVGCGTGIISLHCAKAGAIVAASDISADAARCTKANAARNHLDIDVKVGDLLEGIEGEFDIIVFNPPYLPKDAPDDRRWTGGESGIELTLDFIEQCKGRLAAGGKVVTLVSSLSDSKRFEGSVGSLGYDCRIAAKAHIFFEDMTVYELILARR